MHGVDTQRTLPDADDERESALESALPWRTLDLPGWSIRVSSALGGLAFGTYGWLGRFGVVEVVRPVRVIRGKKTGSTITPSVKLSLRSKMERENQFGRLVQWAKDSRPDLFS